MDLGVKDANGSSLQKIAREKGLSKIIELVCDTLNAKNEQLQEENSGLNSRVDKVEQDPGQDPGVSDLF